MPPLLRTRRPKLGRIVVVLALALTAFGGTASAANVPPGFQETVLVAGLFQQRLGFLSIGLPNADC